jgi:PHD/YefM family antitoxin component YafN of YafNO toxin-antitoxin module
MGAQSVGIREFRDKLATYLLTSDKPLAITRHGDTIGYYLPTKRRRPTPEQLEAIREATAKMRQAMTEAEVTEDEIIEEFQRLRKAERMRKTDIK